MPIVVHAVCICSLSFEYFAVGLLRNKGIKTKKNKLMNTRTLIAFFFWSSLLRFCFLETVSKSQVFRLGAAWGTPAAPVPAVPIMPRDVPRDLVQKGSSKLKKRTKTKLRQDTLRVKVCQENYGRRIAAR